MASPQATMERVAAQTGVPKERLGDIAEYLRSGHIGKYDMGNAAGPVMPAPAWAEPEALQKFGQLFAGQQTVMAKGSPNLTDALTSSSAADKAKFVADTLLGRVDPKTAAPRFAAIDGKPIYSQNAEGSILDQYGGSVDQTSPLAVGTTRLRNEQADQAKAGTVENYAQAGAANAAADHSRASAAKARMETEQGVRTGQIAIVTGPDGSINLVDRRTGQVRQATTADGAVLIGKQSLPPGYRMAADGKSMEAIPGGPAALGKALPTKLVTDLEQQALIADNTARFRDTFKDDYGGKTIMGDTSNVIKRLQPGGDPTGQAQFWQDYSLHEATVRNKLFGASLTPGEQTEWQKLTITPRMDPAEIKKNLARRADIEDRALSRTAVGAASAGYNREQIEAVTGRAVPSKDATKVQPGRGGEPGTPAGSNTVRTPDGQVHTFPSAAAAARFRKAAGL